MTIRKYDKIKENILNIQQYNSKKVEIVSENIPGPGAYSPSYNLIENNGFAVNFIFLINKFLVFFKKST